MEITFKKLIEENYTEVLTIKHALFPESNCDKDYDKYFDGNDLCNYYLIRQNNTPCATIGWYDFDNKKVDAFIGWFGVLPEFCRQGIGTKALHFIIQEVKDLGYKNLRVYTDKIVNDKSIILYSKYFDICEDYTYPDKIGKTNNFVIFSKFFTDEKTKWNNFPLGEDDNYTI